ncbi:MAG: hypothetical protein ABWK01_00830 [Infirmifilum sp.]
MSTRYIGRGVEEALREELREALSEDPEALALSLRLLDEFVHKGPKGVRKFLNMLVEAGDVEGEAAEA